MPLRYPPDVVDPWFPSWDEISAAVDWTGTRDVRDFRGADWSDRTGDHRWRSLDPTFELKPPLKPWGER